MTKLYITSHKSTESINTIQYATAIDANANIQDPCPVLPNGNQTNQRRHRQNCTGDIQHAENSLRSLLLHFMHVSSFLSAFIRNKFYPGLIKGRWWVFLKLWSSFQKLFNSKIYLSAKNVDSNSFATDWSFRMSTNTARFSFAVNLLILIDSTYLYERQGYILSKGQIFTFYSKCLHHKIFLKYCL